MSARALIAEYEKNEVSADQRLRGKRLNVRGQISSIGKDIFDNPFVVLAGGGEGVHDAQLYFDDPARSKLGDLRKGQSLTASCVVDGMLGNVSLKDCSL